MIKISYNLTVKLGDIVKQKADYALIRQIPKCF